ncbi:hypothetical protein [Gilvimarinus agarilyticus]|uniref:hypothetical protein n=1 Tax=Gilvimarinus agarilyticus TaxID=679259 RepID=UPI0005A1EB58|nr:hypothetical protein [Gilvimarinus agarilyticus]
MISELLNKTRNTHDACSDIKSGVALGLISVAWFGLVAVTIERIESYDPELVVKVLTLVGATLGVYVAVWKLVSDLQWKRSEVYLEQAKEFFEKSYAILEVDESTGYPKNSRQLWLSSSRLLLAALGLGKKITDSSHRETFVEYTEYWRIKFRELLDFDGDSTPDESYYYEDGALNTWSRGLRAPLAERSIAVLYRFTDWPDGREDWLSFESDFTDAEIKRIDKFGNSGLAGYCRKRRGGR